MKIVMLCEFFQENLEFQENFLVKYYVKHGHEVAVVTSTFGSVFDYYSDKHDNTTPPKTYTFEGAKIIKLRFRYNILHRLRAYTSIAGILEEERPDLLYVHDIMLNFPEAVAYVKRHPECRMIMDYHCDYSNSGRNQLSLKVLHGVIRKWFLDRARPHLRRIFPVVPAGITFLNEIYKVPLDEMEVLPLGADTDQCEQVRKSGAGKLLRAALGFGDEEIVIFTGGKLAPAKKTELLIEAVRLLPELPLRVVVAGEARPADQAYKAALLEQGAADPRVRFVGWLEKHEMYRYMDMADLAVFPASQSVVWQQAIAMGLPLIAGDVGHQDVSYLNLEDNIIVLPSHRISAPHLAEAIREVVTTPGRRQAMAAGALKVADEHLNWNKLIYRTLRFNQEVRSTDG
jgi:1,2-diacylglycerol 3-alpha-glucosyltransferase